MTGREIKDELLSEAAKAAMELNDDTEYFTGDEFAAKYGYSPSSIRMMLKRKQITRAVKIQNKWIISEDADILVRQNTKKQKIKL